jgi:hypothetical protein
MEPKWTYSKGEFDGSRSTLFGELPDGYLIEVALEENQDGLLVCVGIKLKAQEDQEVQSGINSTYLQQLGIGEIIRSAREEYVERGGFLEDLASFRESERQTKNWPNPGALGHSDEKYAHLARLYQNAILKGLKNPIDELAKHMNCDRETAASRIAEVRKRDLLTRPPQGQLGGRLTKKAERLLGKNTNRKGRNA